MDFRDVAANETTALLTRVLAGHSKATLHQLQAFRKALDAAAKALEAAVNTAPQVGDEIGKLADRLTEAATAEAQAENERAYEEARTAIEAARAELKAQGKEREKLAASLKEMRAQAEALKTEAETQKTRAEAFKTEADAHKTRAETARVEAARAAKQVEAEAAERSKLGAALAALQAQVQTADAQRQTVSALQKANAGRIQTLERGHAERERKFSTLLDQLLSGYQQLSAGTTIGEVLLALVAALGSEFPRVALFRVNGNRLEGEHHVGFEFKTDITKVAIPLSIDSLLTRAITSGAVESLTAADLAEGNAAPFGGKPACAVALPIVVHGGTLAVVYADDAGQSHKDNAAAASHELRTKFADLLLRYADVLIVRLTSELQAIAKLREYAATLLAEAEQMYAADVSAGKKGAELKSRLKENLECARRIFAERADVEDPAAASMIDEQIAALVEERTGTPFGRDLANVIGRGGSRRSAEAS